MDKPKVILVDREGNIQGTKEKLQAHIDSDLHLAFSVILFCYIDHIPHVLLQQRAQDKYHSGLLWSNTCCSHPHEGEGLLAATHRCLKHELGIDPAPHLEHAGSFHYYAELDGGLTEHELDHVFVGVVPSGFEVYPNPDEVQAVNWLSLAKLETELANGAGRYTAWLPQVLDMAKRVLA